MNQLQGIGAAAGLSIGRAIWWRTHQPIVTDHSVQNVDQELIHFANAINQARDEIGQLRKQAAQRMGESEAAVFDAHLVFLDDPAFTGEMEQRIKTLQKNAAWVCQEVTKETKQLLSSLDDEYMRARADDVGDVGGRLLLILTGSKPFDPSQLHAGDVVVADELTPSQTAQFPEGIAGMVTARGSQTAHAAIMARTLGIPAVLGLGASIEQIHSRDTIIVNGTTGECILKPDADTIAQIEEQIKQQQDLQEKALLEAAKDAVTADGKRIQVFANIGGPQDIQPALDNKAEGVGLFRTEFLYLDNQDWPSEDEQYAAYRQVLEAFAPHPVIIRTLDIGGDKELPYAQLPKEENPFLGHRAIRYCLDHPEIFCTQLRALLRASQHGNLWIMLPMIENVAEINKTKQLLEQCKAELDRRNQTYNEDIPLGIMIEVPAAAVIADQLAKEVDFMSIGTNDLTQYTLAADRGNEKVAHLYDAAHPAVLRLIHLACDAAAKQGIPIGMCGELAGDKALTKLLIGLGLDELSMSANSIPQVKQKVRKTDYQVAKEQTEQILTTAIDGQQVRDSLTTK
ncbi:phosphoenolpyruvate--protein phosphotransferase [Seinonella peptonophila]|uniref:Phosphoenolpyruvate-protein phosphotransferase n=1 Tax=Seinonella peptonophila TaxID=112248 RepID=A0A1M4Z5K5_9BACL|nr:phosphoenolpyruvate--protein phosphotransferase [Seinonella peptonophila]SHF12876.1 phosphoenolpyruvate--protein phosphotransferase [Seinonella peptonophila]